MSDQMCVDCRQTFPPAQVDLSPNGWRCQKCSLRHQIDIHSGADSQVGEISTQQMEAKASASFRNAMGAIALGIVFAVALAAGVFSSGREYRRSRSEGGAVFAVPFAFVAAGYELMNWRRAKKAIEIVNKRNAGDPPTL
ncbi:MAG TPA: hypothetical protein VGM90_29185 [Kofleriaceae bacterium]|jgi:hypothetical protein